MKKLHLLSLSLLSLCCTSCFSPALENLEEDSADPDAVRVSFQVGSIEQIPFSGIETRAELSSLCTRITLAIFRDGEKVKNISQQVSDASFGSFNVNLSPGTYQFVLIAHNGLGNCTISKPEEVKFASNKCTDTFYHYGEIVVTEAATTTLDLRRAVAMFRLKTTDAIPAEVSKMQFYYTGGSSTFNPVTGFGSVNSRQTENFSVASMVGQPGCFEVYTFPHEESDELKMTVTAFDAFDNAVSEMELNPLPVTLNKITQATVSFFTGGGGGSASGGYSVTIADDGEWDDIINYN